MTQRPTFILDSDVFIAAKNLYYAFDICPGFWQGLLEQHERGRVFSISRVRGELMAGRKTEDLVKWVADGLRASTSVNWTKSRSRSFAGIKRAAMGNTMSSSFQM